MNFEKAVTEWMDCIDAYEDSEENNVCIYFAQMLIVMSSLMTLGSIKDEERDDVK